LLVDPTSYLEASSTAGFAYGILKSVRKGYLPKRYEAVGIKAVQAILRNIDEGGELQQVSFGTAMGHDMEFYKNIPVTSMPYGQSLAVVALTEFLRTYI
jgi:unsaturated rhamnogalacturonyl hydrolase